MEDYRHWSEPRVNRLRAILAFLFENAVSTAPELEEPRNIEGTYIKYFENSAFHDAEFWINKQPRMLEFIDDYCNYWKIREFKNGRA